MPDREAVANAHRPTPHGEGAQAAPPTATRNSTCKNYCDGVLQLAPRTSKLGTSTRTFFRCQQPWTAAWLGMWLSYSARDPGTRFLTSVTSS
jgi:hypothetical protein